LNTEASSLFNQDAISFQIDANLNDCRAFLLELFASGDSQVRELVVRIIMVLGLARASVEDYLIVVSLLD
jgi:hypothetical protein